MAIRLSPRTEDEINEQMRAGDFRDADEVILAGMALLRARQQLREAVRAGAAEADRGDLLDGEEVFADLTARLRRARDARRG